MVWYRWKFWRLAWSPDRCSSVTENGLKWVRVAGNLFWRGGRVEPHVFRVTDGEKCYSCEAYYDHFLLRPEDGGKPWTTVELSMHGLRKC